MGIGYFEPLDEIGATASFPLKDFWSLVKM
jgi:hypothetical protein